MLGDYIVASSAADENRSGGREIWINTRIPIATKGDQNVKAVNQNVSILVANPRRLIVCMQAAACTVYGINLHAPDVSKGIEVVTAWWCKTYEIIASVVPRNAVIVCSHCVHEAKQRSILG